jgi:PIN like domain
MRVLLDECVPRPLRRQFPAHDVWTIRDMGWAGKKNGELLALMAANGFEVLLTVDRNLRFQQNLAAVGVAIVIMVAASNRLPDLIPIAPAVETAFTTIQPGDAVEES